MRTQPSPKPHLFRKDGCWHLRSGAWHFVGASFAYVWGSYKHSTQWKRLYA